jgi:hypothetical protein
MDSNETAVIAAIIMSGLIRTHSHGVDMPEQRDKVVDTALDLTVRLQAAVEMRAKEPGEKDAPSKPKPAGQGKRDKTAEALKAAPAPFDAA